MADKKFDLVFNASLEVGQVKAAVASLTKSLESAGAKIPQSVTTNLNRMIQSLSTELNKLEGMTDIQLDPKNAKNVGKSYEKIFQTFQQIKAVLGDIHRTAGIDPEKFFPSEVASNIAKAAQAVQKYKKAMEAGIKTDEHTKATKDIADAEKKIKSLNDKLDEAARKRQSSAIVKDQLQETRKKLQIEKDQAEIEDKAAKEAQKTVQERIKSQEKLAQVEEEIAKKKKKQQEAINKAARANEIKNERESMKQAKGKGTDTKIYRDAVASYVESTAEVQKLQGEINQLESEYAQLSQASAVTADEITEANERAAKATAELANVQKRLNRNQADMDAADTKYAAATAEVKTLVPEVQKAENALNQLVQKKEQLELSFEQSTFNELIQELEELGVKLPDTERNMEGVERALDEMADKAKEEVVQALNGVETATEDVNKAFKQTGQAVNDFDDLRKETSRAEQDMENLKNQVLDFFSITNTIQIFKNAIRDAFDTVKELDAAMTETAVVTDFSVGDMWDKLPEYSEEATKLGASIKSLYEATTLYYQQGLQTEEAMGVGIETMKMARIANMDAAQATEAMTAALRGFNMEINETSATRINDVYSELAAVTAADTSQIATAMGKTASIASSANMEFETTAALLAQIIETTQEAPETAGTAMKTIIARFTEVKQLFSQGLLTGEDSEGETIEINKIDAALKTVGISLKDFLTGAKGIDDIFLELASKWNTLDLATQRYIATTAAGSRQQSRFLAMMGNYDRTMELVNAATNSAGASQKQFDKTLESLDAKLQRLENAWAEFTMGLANSDVIKWAVDLLTDLIEGVNKLTGLTGNDGLGGVVTMFIRLGTVIGALKGGQAIITGLIKTISSTFGKPKFLENLTSGMSSGKMGLLQAFLVKKKGVAGGFGKFTTEAKNASKTIDEVKIAFDAAGHGAKGFLSILGRFAPYIAIFSALGFVINKMIKSFQAAQKQTQIDNLNSSMEGLTSQSEQAQTKMEEIADSRDKLDNLNKTLGNLTRGTAEWKKSLFEANNEVLKLIETYPILSNEIAFGTSGQMIIKESGWEALLDQQQRVITNLTNAKIAISAQKATLEKGLAFEQFVTTSGAAYAGTDRQRIDWNAFMYNANLIQQASDNQQVVDLTELKEVLVPDTEQSKLEEKLIDAQIKMANWMDTPAGAAMAAANDSFLSNDLTTSAGASLGKAIADWLGISFMSSTPNQDLHKEVVTGDGYSKQVYEDLLGLTEEQYLLLAETFYDKGITISGDMDTAIFDAVYNELQLPAKALEQVRTAALATANEFNELAKTAGEYSVQEKRLNNQFVSNTIANSSIGGLEYAEAISNFVSSSKKYDEELDKKLEEEKAILEKTYKENGKDFEDKTLEQRYADVMGYFVSNGKIYTDGTYSTQVNADREAMIEAIANANITLQIEKDALQVANLLEGKGERQKSLFNDLFSSEGKGITQSEISKYWNNGVLNIATLTRDLGMSLEEIAGSFGGSVVEVGNLLSSNMIMAMDRIDKQRRDLAKRMTKYSTNKNTTFNDNMNILSGLEQKFGEQIRYALENVFNSLDKTGDFSIISQGFEFFKNTAITGTQQEVDQLTKFIEQINWSDPIDAAYKLNKELAYGSELTKGFAQAVNSLDSSFLGAGAQFESLFSSEIFKDIDEDLTKILEDQNIITEADITELASEYSQLEKLIKNTSVTTKGLAKILTSIKKGDLSFENLTDAVIAALGGMNGLDEATGKVLTRLEKLDLGQDYGEVQKTYTELGEKIEEFQQQGDYGNPQYKAALDYAYGKGWEGDATGEDLINRYKELGDHFEKTLGKNMWYAWADAAKGVDVFGQSLEENAINKLKQLEEQGFSLDFINGESILEIPDDWTFDQTAENLSSVFSGTKELWEDLLTWFGGKDPNFRRSWEKAEYEQMGARVAQAETTKIGDKKIITEQEVQEISAEVQASLEFDEKSVEEVERDLREQLESNDVEILAIVETGDVVADAQNIINQLNTAFGEGGLLFVDSFITQAENGLASLDLTGITTAINSLPISEELSTELINSLVSSTLGAVDQITYLLD